MAPALVAGVTAWTVGQAAPRPAPGAPLVQAHAARGWVRPPAQVVLHTTARCRSETQARRGRRDPFAASFQVRRTISALEEPAEEPTPAQPLPERVLVVAGEALSTAGLSAAQVRLLEEVARLPGLPTEVVGGARYLKVGDRRYRDDCSNALRAPYDALGIDLFSEHVRFPDANGVRLIREKGRAVTEPEVGDLVIFDDTWDRNRNGAADDPDTHAAIVVGFEPGGTVLLYNRVRAGHRVFRMNLRHPELFTDPETGARLNDPLRRKRAADPELARSTGALFARYVRVLD